MESAEKRLMCRRVVLVICDAVYTFKQEECGLFEAVFSGKHCRFLKDKGIGLCNHPDSKKLTGR